MGIYGVVLGHPEGILEACWGILEAGLSYNRGFGMKSSDVWARIAGLREPAQTSRNKLPKVARGALLGAHVRPQTVQMLLTICNFVPRAVHMHGACGNQREPAELNYQKWPEQPFLEPMSAHKTATCYG